MDLSRYLARCTGDGDCLLWTGATNCGVPVVGWSRGGVHVTRSLRRLAYESYFGRDVPKRTHEVKPRCGRPLCISRHCLGLFLKNSTTEIFSLPEEPATPPINFNKVRSVFELAYAI